MQTAALKSRPAPRISRAPVLPCPVEALMRQAAMLERECDAMRDGGGIIPDALRSKAHAKWDQVRAIEVEGNTHIARSMVGAAWQAMLIYKLDFLGTEAEPKNLTKAERGAIFELTCAVDRCAISAARALVNALQDDDLSLLFSVLHRGDSLVEFLETQGFDVMAAVG